MDLTIAYHLYQLQEDSARKKRIPFALSFQQWLDIWGADIDRRGKRAGDLYLERIDKPKGYVVGNLRISQRESTKVKRKK